MQETHAALQEVLARRSSTSRLQRCLHNTPLQTQGKPDGMRQSPRNISSLHHRKGSSTHSPDGTPEEVVDSIYPESQYGFRAGRETVDMIFAMRQIQEKCREQNLDLYMVIDLAKAFDTVNRYGLWSILQERFVSIIRSFHEGILARVYECGELSDPFPVTNGTKRGCVLALTLFSILFSCMLLDAVKDMDKDVYMQFRTDGGLFKLKRLQSRTKTLHMLIRDLLYADDCTLVAHTLQNIQQIGNALTRAAEKFGLTISLKRAEE